MPKEGEGATSLARDQDLLSRARVGDRAAVEALLEAYKPLVLSRAAHYFLAHSERDDLIQEGMIALFQAVLACPPSRFADFSAYAFQAVNNRMVDLLRQEQSQKRQAMRGTLSLDSPGEGGENGSDRPWDATIELDSAGPEEQVLYQERLAGLQRVIQEDLSPQEGQVLLAYLAGQSYEEIGQGLQLTSKSVDSSLQRARRKLRQKLN